MCSQEHTEESRTPVSREASTRVQVHSVCQADEANEQSLEVFASGAASALSTRREMHNLVVSRRYQGQSPVPSHSDHQLSGRLR